VELQSVHMTAALSKLLLNATPLAIRVTMVDARTKPVRTEKL